jgi:DNA-binding HxlR family transcriptional regulator
MFGTLKLKKLREKLRTVQFSELKRLIPEITEKMLIQQLRELEKDKVVDRHVYPEVPPKVEYSFTDYGKSLEPVLQVLCNWGEEHLNRVETL